MWFHMQELPSLVPITGCGKSTVLRLIMRLYDVSSGSVLLNGVDVREVILFISFGAHFCSSAKQTRL